MEKLQILILGLLLLQVLEAKSSSREGRIVGGQDAPADLLHYLANIQYSLPGQGIIQCGGVIYNSQYIITAAHCIVDDNVQPSWMTVKVGSWADNSWRKNEQRIGAQTFYPHPGYNPKDANSNNDIAVIRLKTPIKFGVGVSPIGFAQSNFVSSGTAKISGWGHTGPGQPSSLVPKQANVDIKSYADCKKAYPLRKITDNQMCAGGYPDTCQGDSGGPIVCFDLKDPYVCGITSHGAMIGAECGNPRKPGIYTRTASYRSWLLQVAGSPTVNDPLKKVG